MAIKLKTLVRPLMALAFTGATIYLAVVGKIEPGELMTVTGIIVGFYFGERSALKQPNNGKGDD